MSGACKRPNRKHTPLTSEQQRKFFAIELEKRKKGRKGKLSGVATATIADHLAESKGKNLPMWSGPQWTKSSPKRKRG